MRSSRQTRDVRLSEFCREYGRLNEIELSKFSEARHRARAERAHPKLFNRAFGLGGTEWASALRFTSPERLMADGRRERGCIGASPV
jgi:hypothetical protein